MRQNINYNRIQKAIEYITANAKLQPSLDEVAEFVELSPFHFQQIFVEWAGVSPKQFLQYLNLSHAKKVLRESKLTLFDTAYESGLSGTGRLHDLFVTIEGMTPNEYKNYGKNIVVWYSFGKSQFGNYIVASTDKGISNVLFFNKSKEMAIEDLKRYWPKAVIIF